jgi:hypothetical protein
MSIDDIRWFWQGLRRADVYVILCMSVAELLWVIFVVASLIKIGEL